MRSVTTSEENRVRTSLDVRLTIGALAVTLLAASLSIADIVAVLGMRAGTASWGGAVAQALFLMIVGYLIYGACVYLLARLGYLRRIAAHVPASQEALTPVYCEPDPPLVTILVPSYMEDERVIRRTLLCAALQTYPRRRVVLLIDDAPVPKNVQDAARLTAARRLPGDVEALLCQPRRLCTTALRAFFARQAAGPLDGVAEHRALGRLHADLGSWFECQADRYPVIDHADRLFVEMNLRQPARACRAESSRLLARAPGTPPVSEAARALEFEYRRLLARFDVELASFERKRYENLSHAPNKAMNLNSYIGLLGGTFCEAVRDRRLFLEPTDAGRAELHVPASEFLLVLDADSILLPDYALRLVHFMREPGHDDVAIVQTPYSAFPGAPGTLERVAGATTDIQYLIHQGFTRYGATYWVGANAVVRTAALADIATRAVERGHDIVRFVQDRTLIEDTESTVDLLARGWRLHNYPERLAYSETPPDFGALLIQRRRWANGGLIILPKLIRHLVGRGGGTGGVGRGLMMTHYLTSLAAVNVGLLLVLAFPFEDSMRSLWLPFTALPYYLMCARDLRLFGYSRTDVLRVYALNLVLIPVNLVGVLASLSQAVCGAKAAFGRTPKHLGRTPVPAIYLAAELGLGLQWLLRALGDVLQHRPVHALLALANLGFLAYGLACLIGLWGGSTSVSAPFHKRPTRPDESGAVLADRRPAPHAVAFARTPRADAAG